MRTITAAAVVVGTLVLSGAPPALAQEAQVMTDEEGAGAQQLPAGVELTPSELGSADAVVVADPGQAVTATVLPAGCEDPSICAYVIHTVGAAEPDRQRPATAAAHGW